MQVKLITYIIILLSVYKNINAQDLRVSILTQNVHCKNGSASLNINSGASPFHILWSNGSSSTEINDLTAGDYSVSISDDNNKDTIIYFTIKTDECEPIASNCFTPNDDGYNDTWNISGIEYFPEFDLYVYNRWGQLVHYQTNNFKPWDGKQFGINVADGAYYFILYLDKSNKNKFIKGDVNILR